MLRRRGRWTLVTSTGTQRPALERLTAADLVRDQACPRPRSPRLGGITPKITGSAIVWTSGHAADGGARHRARPQEIGPVEAIDEDFPGRVEAENRIAVRANVGRKSRAPL